MDGFSLGSYRILPETRKLIFRLHLKGFSAVKISKHLQNTHNPVSVYGVRKLVQKIKTHGHFQDLPRSGRRRKLDEQILIFIDKETDKNRELEAEALANKIYERFSIRVCPRTVSIYRRDLGWVYENTRYCQFIRAVNKEKRLKWCLERIAANETFEDFVFTDECTVMLERAVKKRYRRIYEKVACLHARVKHPVKVHVWAGISARGATSLALFDGKERLNSRNYCRILKKFYVPFAAKAYGGQCVLAQDNAPMHTSRLTTAYLEKHQIMTTDWPPESPDLNCIESVWHQLKHFLRKNTKPTSKEELMNGIKEFWATKMTPGQCIKYVNHTRNWVHKVIDTNGGPTGK